MKVEDWHQLHSFAEARQMSNPRVVFLLRLTANGVEVEELVIADGRRPLASDPGRTRALPDDAVVEETDGARQPVTMPARSNML